MTSLARNVILYGSEVDLPQPIPLCAGPLSLFFEAGDLRYVRLGEHEIIRRIYMAVRDHNWATIPMRISDLKIDSAEDHFKVSYSADHEEREIDFQWDATIQGSSEGIISFSMQGHARSTFMRNRIGFCVLHPPQCAGALCRVVQEFGAIIEKPFPQLIAPAPKEDPFQEIREMSYSVADGIRAEFKFEGDVFETEDQRNWSDGSYKTFCTPLRLPFPVKVEAGTEVWQRVQLQLQHDKTVSLPTPSPSAKPAPVRLRLSGQTTPLTAVGLGITNENHSPGQTDRLKSLNLSHLRTELHFNSTNAHEDYLFAAHLATRIGTSLEIALYLNHADRDLEKLVQWIRPQHAIARWLIFQEGDKTTSPDALAAARRILVAHSPQAQFGGGSAAYFTELNRERPNLSAADVVCYSINPQVHAFDNTSLIENALAIRYTIESARELAAGRSVAVSPITLRPRFNPDATGAAAQPAPDILPDAVDARQMSLFGAVWTLAAIKSLAESRAATATFFETVGWLGVIERDEGSRAPEQFRSVPGGAFPLYHVLAAVGQFRGGEVLHCDSTQPLAVAGLALRKQNRMAILLANLTSDPREVLLEGALAGKYEQRRLDESNVLSAMEDAEAFLTGSGDPILPKSSTVRIEVPPYGLVFLSRQQREPT